MPQEQYKERLPLFAKVGALTDLAVMARKLVLMRKAVEQIRAIEDKLEANLNSTRQDDFLLAMKETVYYAKVAADAAGAIVDVMRKLKPRVEAYQRSLRNAAL